MVYIIIVAAGRGKRMKKGKNKVLLEINKKPLIYYPIILFEKNTLVDKILLVVRKVEIKLFFEIIRRYRFKKILDIIPGGKERQDSSFAGLKYLKKIGIRNGDVVLIHNGANPLVNQKTISGVILAVKKYGAAVCGFPVRDTIKKVKNGYIKKTLERKDLWQIQTPQGAKFCIFWEAFLKAKKDKFFATDDTTLIERLNKRVKVIKSPVDNIKITYPEDLEFIKYKLCK